MPARRFPPHLSVEDVGGCFVVKASNDRPLIFIYYGEGVGRRSLARLLTRAACLVGITGRRVESVWPQTLRNRFGSLAMPVAIRRAAYLS
jgi:hypothetical protein